MKEFEEKIKECDENNLDCWNCKNRIGKLLTSGFCKKGLYRERLMKEDLKDFIENYL